MNATIGKTLLVVWHSRTGTAEQMKNSAIDGARAVIDELRARQALAIIARPACEASARELLHADGYLFCAPENLAALSGAMKEFFDRNYYAVLDPLNGRPYGPMLRDRERGVKGKGVYVSIELGGRRIIKKKTI